MVIMVSVLILMGIGPWTLRPIIFIFKVIYDQDRIKVKSYQVTNSD